MKFLIVALMFLPMPSQAEEDLPLADLAIAGATTSAVIYEGAKNRPEIKRLKEKYSKNELALKRAKAEDLPKFAELESLQKEADAFMYRDRDVLASKKRLADLELAMSDPKNGMSLDGINLDHLNEHLHLKNKAEPAAMKKWAAAHPEKAARYEQLLGELDGAEHLAQRTAMAQSLKRKINIRRGIRAVSVLGAGYTAYVAADHLKSNPAEINSRDFARKSERASRQTENHKHSMEFDLRE